MYTTQEVEVIEKLRVIFGYDKGLKLSHYKPLHDEDGGEVVVITIKYGNNDIIVASPKFGVEHCSKLILNFLLNFY